MGVIGQDSAQRALVGLRGRSIQSLRPYAGIAAGLVLGLISLVIYISEGYSKGMLWLWLAALLVLAVAFGLRSRELPRVALADVGVGAGVVALAVPLYLAALYRWPVQVSSDETSIMDVAKQYANIPGADPFGVSWYFSRPAGLFIVWGKLGETIGGIDLFHMRLLHAIVGLLIVAFSYALFRLMLPRLWAAFATVLIAASHSLVMISRLAMRENTALFVLVVSLVLLLWGLRHRHELAIFLGGVTSGLGFYSYEPGRVTFAIWIAFLIGLGLLYRSRFPARQLLTVGAISAAGFLLIATPILYSESQVPASQRSGPRDSLMIYHNARVTQQGWVFADSELDGWLTNVGHGLTTYNGRTMDNSWIYPNPGHGFVDPVTGILLWVGVGVVGVGLLRRRREDEGALLMLGGFLVLWLSFAFLINKSPNYTRLLVTLPFVAFLVTEAVRWLAGRWRSIPRAPALLATGFLAAIVVSNLAIAWDFIDTGRREGDPIGSTGRYAEARKDNPGQRFYIAQSAGQPYYVWGNHVNRLVYFANDPSQVADADPVSMRDFSAPAPFSLFMRREVWQTAATELSDRYPRGRIRNITPDGARVVLEVPSS